MTIKEALTQGSNTHIKRFIYMLNLIKFVLIKTIINLVATIIIIVKTIILIVEPIIKYEYSKG